jgi:hypothetical protein
MRPIQLRKHFLGNRYNLVGSLATVFIFGLSLYLLLPQVFSAARPPQEQLEASTQAFDPDLLFQDGFTDPHSGWPAGDQAKASFGYQRPTFYYLEVQEAESSAAVFRGLNLTDFVVETKALVNFSRSPNGDFRYGLAIRRSEKQYYAFTLSPRTGVWQVRKYAPNGARVLAEDRDSALRGTFQLFTLRVTARGETFSFDINGQTVASLSDPDYLSGDVGFIVETLDESVVRVIYDSLLVRKLESQPVVLASSNTSSFTAPTPTPASTDTPVPPTSTPSPTPIAVLALPTSTPSPVPTATPAPPSPTPSLTSTATPEPATLTPSKTPTSTAIPPTQTAPPVATATPGPSGSNPTPTSTASATPTASIPTGTFVLLNPLDPNDPSYGLTEFEWAWTGAVPAGYGFEVRVWREGEPVAGVHNAVEDNQNGNIQSLGGNQYRLSVDVRGAAGVQGRSGEYLWTVAVVQISPNYADLGQQAQPAHFRFEAGGGGGGGGGDGSGGGSGGGGVGIE